jgi:DNA gyrase/topoisomerase IV subunit B
LETGFRFNDAVLRHLTRWPRSKAETTPSIMMKAVEREESRKAAQEARGLSRQPLQRPSRLRADRTVWFCRQRIDRARRPALHAQPDCRHST